MPHSARSNLLLPSAQIGHLLQLGPDLLVSNTAVDFPHVWIIGFNHFIPSSQHSWTSIQISHAELKAHFCTSGHLLCDVRLVVLRLTTTDKITRFPHASHVLSRKLDIGWYRLNWGKVHLAPRKKWRWLFPSKNLVTTFVYQCAEVLWFEALACYRLEQESHGCQCKHCGV